MNENTLLVVLLINYIDVCEQIIHYYTGREELSSVLGRVLF